jgi:PAS domain-containing protein
VLLMRGGRFLYANPRALELAGFETPEQIIGLPAEELIAAQDLAMVRERSSGASWPGQLADRDPRPAPRRITAPDGDVSYPSGWRMVRPPW